MALRLHDSVLRGEFDFRTKGRITGTLDLQGLPEPLVISLRGLPSPDLAGVLLRFHNPAPLEDAPPGVATEQSGYAGDLTASRKNKVPDCSREELSAHIRAGTPFPWHWGNTLYLEWYSERNGRVVIESSNYELQIEGPALWRMSEEDEKLRTADSESAMQAFLEELGNALCGLQPPPVEDVDLSEEEREADEWDRRMNLLNDRIEARLNALDEIPEYDEYDRIYEEEREKLRVEWGEPEPEPLTPEEEAERERWIDEMNAAAADAFEELEEEGYPERRDHPLVQRCNELGHKINADIQEGAWMPEHAPQEHPLRELVWGVQFAAAKLAGALTAFENEEEWPPDEFRVGNVLVRLKKACGLLRDALAGLDAADEENLAHPAWRQAVREEINELLAEVLRLLDEARGTLE